MKPWHPGVAQRLGIGHEAVLREPGLGDAGRFTPRAAGAIAPMC